MKILLIFCIGVSLSGCVTAGQHVSDSPNAWINVGDGGKFLFWCEAKTKEGVSAPVCYEPQYKKKN